MARVPVFAGTKVRLHEGKKRYQIVDERGRTRKKYLDKYEAEELRQQGCDVTEVSELDRGRPVEDDEERLAKAMESGQQGGYHGQSAVRQILDRRLKKYAGKIKGAPHGKYKYVTIKQTKPDGTWIKVRIPAENFAYVQEAERMDAEAQKDAE